MLSDLGDASLEASKRDLLDPEKPWKKNLYLLKETKKETKIYGKRVGRLKDVESRSALDQNTSWVIEGYPRRKNLVQQECRKFP